ncbi:hypothetical protein ACFJZF_09190 [Enterococcus faecalis]|uniref:hypothetical protein n=1 Tax=Enterococcus faecalis TaxID=1351 RepID=UPI00115CD366|nr:hypothetical protein [Enterococcus faecalis]EGO5804639.1 hypothetical protein [Enterococcus faecalis]EGO5827115.1 hypothetical protein [Enterococcus faecalis]EGO6511692.1 hypothetical protein [Enterococcus faecalis]EGO8713898.1 hypothetical protein [Enterococcus faecalis]EHA4033214.1 hypothetical protein [Enterococcus faecalis]
MSTFDSKIELLFEKVVNYAEKNDIKKIIIFAKEKNNVLKLRKQIGNKNIQLIVTTFPMNQVLYLEDENENIEEYYPELYEHNERMILENEGIQVLSSTLPLESVIIPGYDANPYDIIKRTLNLFGVGIDLVVQSALMTTDMGATVPNERVISMNTITFVDMNTTNSRYLFHPSKKIKINSINE